MKTFVETYTDSADGSQRIDIKPTHLINRGVLVIDLEGANHVIICCNFILFFHLT